MDNLTLYHIRNPQWISEILCELFRGCCRGLGLQGFLILDSGVVPSGVAAWPEINTYFHNVFMASLSWYLFPSVYRSFPEPDIMQSG